MKNKFIVLIVLAISTMGCKTSQNKSEKEVGENTTAHNSRNSLDWIGTYQGLMPCDDCEGVAVELTLNSDLTYNLARKYVGESDETFKQQGNFKWDGSGNRIILIVDAEQLETIRYQVGENQLIKLGSNGKTIKRGPSKMYSLKKLSFDEKITGKYWKLIELRGKQITYSEGQGREAHFTLKANNKVTGHGGCNSFSGTYELEEYNRIHFSKMASTKMACMNINYENEYLKIFEMADNYSIKGDTLSLNKARMAPLARFVAVYF